ncbi:12346_t:CDS:1 [Ambispora gerdemannii]|uniref:12346_t:CDS:1 n=1 Tax=Ambispora gerdemannii TaxID=144530 RepID=A0A9N9D507_9GLOM|nr:12346_t:CDS:1 [Ambispora gerdemannii]
MSKHCQNKNRNSILYIDPNKSFDTNEKLIIKEITVSSPYDEKLFGMLKKFSQLDDANVMSKRPPNSFILYRKAFQQTLIDNNIHLYAGKISGMASKKWKIESDSIKQEYAQIASEIRESSPKYVYLPSSQKKSKDKYKWRIYNNYSDITKRKKSSSSNKDCEFSTIGSKQNYLTSKFSVIDPQDSASFLLQESIPSTSTENVCHNVNGQFSVNPQQLIQSQPSADHTSRFLNYNTVALNYEHSAPNLSISDPQNMTSFQLAMEEVDNLEMIDMFLKPFPLTLAEISYQETTFPFDDKDFMTINSNNANDNQSFVDPQQLLLNYI